MSEKQQGTACHTREKMLNRYGDELHHKHDKNHIQYRKHYKSHPVQTLDGLNEEGFHRPEGRLRIIKLRNVGKRLDKGRFH